MQLLLTKQKKSIFLILHDFSIFIALCVEAEAAAALRRPCFFYLFLFSSWFSSTVRRSSRFFETMHFWWVETRVDIIYVFSPSIIYSLEFFERNFFLKISPLRMYHFFLQFVSWWHFMLKILEKILHTDMTSALDTILYWYIYTLQLRLLTELKWSERLPLISKISF